MVNKKLETTQTNKSNCLCVAGMDLYSDLDCDPITINESENMELLKEVRENDDRTKGIVWFEFCPRCGTKIEY